MKHRTEASLLHVDMDSFFVSVERLERPELVGRPVAVAHDSPRSVVSSASYEARRYGVRSAMPVSRAKQVCPDLVLLPPAFDKYRRASRAVMSIFAEFTPLVEPLSIDEAFLDVRGAMKLFGPPVSIAHELRRRVRERTHLPASVGLATTKFVAKLASQRAKPDGVLEIPPDQTLEFLHALPVEALWGVGNVTAERLRSRAIRTVRDLATEPRDSLEQLLGRATAEHLHHLAHGRDPREVEVHRREKSIGHEETFESDVVGSDDVERAFLRLSQDVGRRLRARHVAARTVAIKVRWAPFETVTRSRTLPEPTQVSRRIFTTVLELFDGLGQPGRPVRLLGVRGEQLIADEHVERGLWSDDERYRQLDDTVDELSQRFGRDAIGPARLLE